MNISNPRRILAVSLAEASDHLSRVITGKQGILNLQDRKTSQSSMYLFLLLSYMLYASHTICTHLYITRFAILIPPAFLVPLFPNPSLFLPYSFPFPSKLFPQAHTTNTTKI